MNPKDAPYQSNLSRGICTIEVFEEFSGGLLDIEGFSYLILLYWMHKSKKHSLLVQTPWDADAHGLFATRSPNRPNPVGVSVVKLIKREGNILTVDGIDAVEGTPLIDIKPYIPSLDCQSECDVGWMSH
jgi:tRNA-Thr(GGU) m(6)t(6)A37 methyltransferase TsaA